MNKWIVYLIVIATTIGNAKWSEAINCPNGLSVSISGDQYMNVGTSKDYTCTGSPSGGTFNWTCSSGFTITSGQTASTATVQARSTPSGAKDDQFLKCKYTVASGDDCEDEKKITIVKIAVTPTTMNVVESKNSSSFTCTVSPTGLSPTYKWLSGSQENA